MSSNDLLVVIVGILAGYWLVSYFLTSNKARGAFNPEAEDSHQWTDTDDAADQQRQKQTREGPVTAWHEVLNVLPDADIQEIQHAYKMLMGQYHPDKVASLGPELRELCERKSKEINAAFDRAMAVRKSP